MGSAPSNIQKSQTPEDLIEKPESLNKEHTDIGKGKEKHATIQCSDAQGNDGETKQELASNEVEKKNTFLHMTRTPTPLDKLVLPPINKLPKNKIVEELNYTASASKKRKAKKGKKRLQVATIYAEDATNTPELLEPDYLLSSDVIDDSEDRDEGQTDYVDPSINAQCPVEYLKEKRNFSKIDQLTLKTQYDQAELVESLVLTLVKPAETQLEKIRAIYIWIVNSSRFTSDNLPPNKDNAIEIKKKKGAAYLFDFMCKVIGVDVKIIKGFKKNNSLETTFIKTSPTNHSWNAVKVLDKWYLIDCSCAIENDFLTDFYFLATPSLFINSHFPFLDSNDAESTELQFLDSPITLDDFNKAVKLEPRAILWGVQPLSHKEKTINVTGPIDIFIGNESGSLDQVKSELLNYSDKNHQKGCVFTRKSDYSKRIIITVKTRSIGKYFLDIYGHVDPTTSTLWLLMRYGITSVNFIDLVPFPDDSFLWGIKPLAVTHGLCPEHLSALPVSYETDKELLITVKTLRPVLGLLELKSAQNVEIRDRYCLVETSANLIKMKVRFPARNYYKLNLYLQQYQKAKESYDLVGKFLVDARKLTIPLLPFPRTYAKFMEYNCSLAQPNH